MTQLKIHEIFLVKKKTLYSQQSLTFESHNPFSIFSMFLVSGFPSDPELSTVLQIVHISKDILLGFFFWWKMLIKFERVIIFCSVTKSKRWCFSSKERKQIVKLHHINTMCIKKYSWVKHTRLNEEGRRKNGRENVFVLTSRCSMNI